VKSFEHWITTNPNLEGIGIGLLIILAGFLLTRGAVRWLLGVISKHLPKRFKGWEDAITAFINPVRVIVMFSAILYALHVMGVPHAAVAFATQVYRSILFFSIGYGFYTLAGNFDAVLEKLNEKTPIQIDSIVIPFIKRTVQFIVMALTITIILSDWGINVNGIFAGLGLAGLAVSMAAQDPIKNLLGGIIIITEKPFQIGDWIAAPSVEGIAEDITFRSTLVRTFDGALVIVPNAILSNQPITNWNRLDTRKMTLTFMLNMATPTKDIMALADEVQDALLADKRFEDGSQKAYVNQITTRGYEFVLTAAMKMGEGADWSGTKAEINMAVIRLLNKYDIKLSEAVVLPDVK
jgi:MscS family membrane protein